MPPHKEALEPSSSDTIEERCLGQPHHDDNKPSLKCDQPCCLSCDKQYRMAHAKRVRPDNLKWTPMQSNQNRQDAHQAGHFL